MNRRVVVLDCDWFTFGSEKLIKQIAFCEIESKASRLYKLTIPRCLAFNSESFHKQAQHSHGLDWSEKGEYSCDRVSHILNDIIQRLDSTHDIIFWAKGREKAMLLSSYGFDVLNLDAKKCPRYRDLTNRRMTTRSKAETFADWMREHTEHDFLTHPQLLTKMQYKTTC